MCKWQVCGVLTCMFLIRTGTFWNNFWFCKVLAQSKTISDFVKFYSFRFPCPSILFLWMLTPSHSIRCAFLIPAWLTLTRCSMKSRQTLAFSSDLVAVTIGSAPALRCATNSKPTSRTGWTQRKVWDLFHKVDSWCTLRIAICIHLNIM